MHKKQPFKTPVSALKARCVTLLLSFTAFSAAASDGQVPAQTLAADPAPAALVSGYWQVTSRPDLKGAPMISLPKTTGLCITPEQVAVGQVQVPSMPSCKVGGGKWAGNQLVLDVVCAGLPAGALATGELLAAGKSFSGKVDVISQPQYEGPARGHFIYHLTGSWVGAECPGLPRQ